MHLLPSQLPKSCHASTTTSYAPPSTACVATVCPYLLSLFPPLTPSQVTPLSASSSLASSSPLQAPRSSSTTSASATLKQKPSSSSWTTTLISPPFSTQVTITSSHPFSYFVQACAQHHLDSVPINFKPGYAVSVVLASQGYPGPYPTGKQISFSPSSSPCPYTPSPPYKSHLILS